MSAHSRRPDLGQGLAEYALVLALIAICAVMALLFLSGNIGNLVGYNRSDATTRSAGIPPVSLPSGLVCNQTSSDPITFTCVMP